ncbi:hypothetical protein L2E82_00715 [Cichorium intybus]|uniref:Uncharacterized protein n=1 Tax=Cichorium intybus TaxID=13427 RepID=A0ACB9GX99_CICIN|nr:hypothetical protein L2E82_00715 [Cichorium intybus]
MEVDEDALQSHQQVVQARHSKKRALKKKAFSVSFNEKDLRKRYPYLDLETADVSQLCLKREALHCQYKQLSHIQSENSKCYNNSAQQFQQFQVLLLRCIENEPFERGLRPEIYAQTRNSLFKLLQVPNILDKKEMTEEESGMVVQASDLLKIIDLERATQILEYHPQIIPSFYKIFFGEAPLRSAGSLPGSGSLADPVWPILCRSSFTFGNLLSRTWTSPPPSIVSSHRSPASPYIRHHPWYRVLRFLDPANRMNGLLTAVLVCLVIELHMHISSLSLQNKLKQTSLKFGMAIV